MPEGAFYGQEGLGMSDHAREVQVYGHERVDSAIAIFRL
jgi:hypothetical protein